MTHEYKRERNERGIRIGETDYLVLTVKPYPNAKNVICNNVLLAYKDGNGKHWIADYVLAGPAEPPDTGVK